MFYSGIAVSILLASAQGFSMPKAPQRLVSLKMSEEPWFPASVASNVVDINTLKYVYYN